MVISSLKDSWSDQLLGGACSNFCCSVCARLTINNSLSAVERWKLQLRNDLGERKTEKHEQTVMEVQMSF